MSKHDSEIIIVNITDANVEDKPKRKNKDFYSEEMLAKVTQYKDPKVILKELKKEISGQDEALKKLALVAAQRDAAILVRRDTDNVVKGSKLIIAGDSGCGKSYAVHKLAEITDSLLIRIDITQYTSAGYVGLNISELFKKDIPKRMEEFKKHAFDGRRAIVFIDEIDKITKAANKDADHQQAVMNELLVILDEYESSNDVNGKMLRDVLFVFAGSFGAYRAKKATENNKAEIGFGGKTKGDLTKSDYKMTLQDFEKAGVSQELLGRIGHAASMSTLDKQALINILNHKKNSPLNDIYSLAVPMGITKRLKKKDLDFIAEEAIKRGLGARGLRIVAEEIVFGDL